MAAFIGLGEPAAPEHGERQRPELCQQALRITRLVMAASPSGNPVVAMGGGVVDGLRACLLAQHSADSLREFVWHMPMWGPSFHMFAGRVGAPQAHALLASERVADIIARNQPSRTDLLSRHSALLR